MEVADERRDVNDQSAEELGDGDFRWTTTPAGMAPENPGEERDGEVVVEEGFEGGGWQYGVVSHPQVGGVLHKTQQSKHLPDCTLCRCPAAHTSPISRQFLNGIQVRV